jgi:translation initiation factor 3 subunit F
VALGAGTEERVGLDALVKATLASSTAAVAAGTPPSEVSDAGTDLDALEQSMKRLQGLLETALVYVEDVVAGRRPADEATGRAIAETLASVPTADAASFERTFASSVQDALMVSYLSHLTQAQMKLAERIAALSSSAAGQQQPA